VCRQSFVLMQVNFLKQLGIYYGAQI
jgi:hypothetical protein